MYISAISVYGFDLGAFLQISCQKVEYSVCFCCHSVSIRVPNEVRGYMVIPKCMVVCASSSTQVWLCLSLLVECSL